jgi:HSP20 family molecular chaperone IbpA
MFKKKCSKCGEKVDSKYKFCPNCGTPLNSEKENWGMLGKDDSLEEFENSANSFFGNFGGKVIGKIFESTMRMLEKEMQKEAKNRRNYPRTNMQLFINGKKINLEGENQQVQQIKKQKRKVVVLDNLSQKNLKKISGLPKQEPLTKIRRFSDKIIYEIEMPGVQSIKDISIIKLENSIEIKALAKNKAYFKLIPINFPITYYNLSKGKLILELDAKN